MDTVHILSLLKSDPVVKQTLLGVFPIDKLPQICVYPSSMVINLDDSKSPGSHWVSLYFDQFKNCDYFDSYGLKPNAALKKFINKHTSSLQSNKKQLQQPLTSTCGQFCIFFLIWRSRSVPLNTIVKYLEQPWSDHFVTGFVNSLFKTNTTVYDSDFIVNQISNMFKNE